MASDAISEVLEAQAREGERIVFVDGRPRHIDRHSSNTIDDLRKIWMDFFLFDECDVLIASASNFSRWSSYRQFYCPHICNEHAIRNVSSARMNCHRVMDPARIHPHPHSTSTTTTRTLHELASRRSMSW